MTEQEEFEQFTAGIKDSATETPAETPATEPAKEPEATPAEEPAKEAPAKEEPPKEEPPKEAEKKVDWAAKAAAEKEKRVARHAARLAAEQKEREFAEAKAKAARLDEILTLSKEKRLTALEKLGMSVDDINTEYIKEAEANPDRPPPYVSALEKKLEEQTAMLKMLAERETKREAEALERQRQETLKSIETSVADTLKNKADDLELLSRHKQGKEIVINLLAAHHEETGEVMDIEQACRLVEEHLLEDLKPFAETKKLRAQTSKPADTQTISGDMRQAEPRGAPGSDDDREFLNTGLRIVTQAG